MSCADCKFFKVLYNPTESNMYVDPGRAICRKHDLIVDFKNEQALRRLTCVEDETEYDKTRYKCIGYYSGESIERILNEGPDYY